MKVTINTYGTEKLMEVETPFFGHFFGHAFHEYLAVFSETKRIAITIFTNGSGPQISFDNIHNAINSRHDVITKEDFIDAYERAQIQAHQDFVKNLGFKQQYDPIRSLVGDGEE